MSIRADSLSDDEDIKKIAEANFQKIRHKSNKIGYADGVSDGQEQTFQTAFDTGYADGLRTGFELEKYRVFFENWSALKIPDEELNKEKMLFLTMSDKDATDASHCRFPKLIEEPITTNTNHQKDHVDKFLRQCQQTLPLTTNLLVSQNVE